MATGRWPVSCRLQRNELLYSWLARTAGVYGLSPSELLPETETFELTSRLVYEASPHILKSLAARSGISVRVLAKRTLAGANPTWPSSWWLGHLGCQTRPLEVPEPSLQVCPRCVADDARSRDGIQFLRLRWQCSATTICQRHLVPLEKACVHCHSTAWPISERVAFHRYRFVCVNCGSMQEEEDGEFMADAGEGAVKLLARFENQLLRALANCAIDWCWIGHAAAKEFLQLVEDLLWAMTRPSYQSKPIYRLQTSAFPFCERSLQPSVVLPVALCFAEDPAVSLGCCSQHFRRAENGYAPPRSEQMSVSLARTALLPDSGIQMRTRKARPTLATCSSQRIPPRNAFAAGPPPISSNGPPSVYRYRKTQRQFSAQSTDIGKLTRIVRNKPGCYRGG